MDNSYFNIAKKRATGVLKDHNRVVKLFFGIGRKLKDSNLEFSGIGNRIKVLVRMLKAYVGGKYRVVPWKSIIVVTAVLIYFVMPFDLMPDFIPVTGYIDDFALVMWLFNHLEDDINTFLWWEKKFS